MILLSFPLTQQMFHSLVHGGDKKTVQRSSEPKPESAQPVHQHSDTQRLPGETQPVLQSSDTQRIPAKTESMPQFSGAQRLPRNTASSHQGKVGQDSSYIDMKDEHQLQGYVSAFQLSMTKKRSAHPDRGSKDEVPYQQQVSSASVRQNWNSDGGTISEYRKEGKWGKDLSLGRGHSHMFVDIDFMSLDPLSYADLTPNDYLSCLQSTSNNPFFSTFVRKKLVQTRNFWALCAQFKIKFWYEIAFLHTAHHFLEFT